MTLKLVACKTDPPLATLVVANLVKADVAVSVEWDTSTCLTVQGTSLTVPSSISRYLARSAPKSGLYGDNILDNTEVDHWLTFSNGPLSCGNEFREAILYLDKILGPTTYLVRNRLTLADLTGWETLYKSKAWADLLKTDKIPTNVSRWYKYIDSLDIVMTVKSSLPKIRRQAESGNASKQKDEGKFVELPGAEMGKVVVRFPPEASGYLHIGHAKAALLNQYYKDAFQGTLIMRFDDTNPAKEKVDFEKVILEDLEQLKITPDKFTHTSNYFDIMLEFCEKLLRQGHAYVDDTEPELMKREREQRTESKNRNNSVEKNFVMWEEMKAGSELGQMCCVRAKIDMSSNNGCMRDPTIYRCKAEPHPRTGTQYKVYPTYDFACPIVDSIEGVTHCLRTMEYRDRDEQFYWFIDVLGLRKPYIWEYSRLNMMNTVLSKRKLTWFVDVGLVDGWDDPRFPTVRGILRRGMTVEGLKQFIIAQGSSRSVVLMEWDKIWAFNKKIIDPIAPRYTSLAAGCSVPVHVSGINAMPIVVPLHPKNPAVGNKTIWVGPKLLIDKEDAAILTEEDNATFINWGNLYIVKIKRSGKRIVSIEAEPNIGNTNYKDTVKLTWLAETDNAPFVPCVCVYFDHIISKAVLGKDEDFRQFVATNTRREVPMLGDPELLNVKKSDIIQLQRRGFFICDSEYKPPSLYSSRASPLILFHIPDGRSKEVPKAPVTPPAPKLKVTVKSDPKPSKVPSDAIVKAVSKSRAAASIYQSVAYQTDLVERLERGRGAEANLSVEREALKTLRISFELETGLSWEPGLVLSYESTAADAPAPTAAKAPAPTAANAPAPTAANAPAPTAASGMGDAREGDLHNHIVAQGDKVRSLKSQKAKKEVIDAEVKILLSLKAAYKDATGADWKPPTPTKTDSKKIMQGDAQNIAAGTKPQGSREKTQKIDKPQKATQAKKENTIPVKKEGEKKQSRLGLEATKEENLAEWYSQVITKGELIEYYDVSGCYIYRPWSFAIWEFIRNFLDAGFKKHGVQNCYFPLFVSRSVLEKEKTHIADFAPEVAWVTKSGDADLAEPIAVRPTSETAMYPAYAKWIHSYRDLPIKLNQWNNVVRWEFKQPQPFLRTREFLWQEGHTAYASKSDAETEVLEILGLYEQVYTDLLAIPVIKGRKTEKEKFAGGDYTTTVEAFISASGRAIQGATSHHLGQNFSKMFDIMFEDPETAEKKYVYQNSWGITTRTIGVMIMVHADNQGLVLPPKVASIQVVIVPCGITVSMNEESKKRLLDSCQQLEGELKKVDVRVLGDYRDNYSPGWRFNHWELKGVPIRIELGPKDLTQQQIVAVRRDTGEKLALPRRDAPTLINALLLTIQQNMLARAQKDLTSHTVVCKNWHDFCKKLDEKNIILSPFCGDEPCEEQIKKGSARDVDAEPGAPSMGAKSLCIPFEQPAEISPLDKCINPDCKNKPNYYTLFGRSY